MPQININEIDQSVFTRVISDDYVKVVVPGIASFGPTISDSDTDFNSITFTDINEFQKTFGYTEPEYNPFKGNDVSRLYAKQLIQRGAAVTFLRVNSGNQAIIYDQDTADDGIIPAVYKSLKNFDKVPKGEKPEGWDTDSSIYYYIKSKRDTAPTQVAEGAQFDATVQYYKLSDTSKFCPQINQIVAKYSGSFGNRLMVTFTPVTSKNTSFAYQYSNVTVYRAAVVIETSQDSEGNVTVNKKITGVHKLESHLVTTNPNDANYFANEELFQYIRILPTATAYDELSVIWSNTDVSPIKDTTVYSGFPDIPAKYIENGMSMYNSEALLTGGTDFDFDEGLGAGNTLNETLGKGFGGFTVSGNSNDSDKVTRANINRWIWASYRKDTGVVANILNTVADCYENYSDPYIYDFDFITSGGFIDENYTIIDSDDVNHKEISTQDEVNEYLSKPTTGDIGTLAAMSDRDSIMIPDALLPIHTSMLNLATTRKDCIALLDSGPDWEPNAIPSYVELVNTSFATLHNPWCYCNNPYNLGTILMPPSFIFLYTLLSNLINNTEDQKWFPPAGVTRATARIVKKPKYEIGSVILNNWQNDTLARVNPIMKLKNYGYVIYGQSTAYVAQDEFTHSALESLNVRLISNCVKKQIFNTCLKLTFEPNNSSLWMKFYDAMDKYLLFMKRNNGLFDYRIQMDESTVTTDDINELRCPGKIWINPTRAAEFFDIDFILTEAGVTFTDTTGEGE